MLHVIVKIVQTIIDVLFYIVVISLRIGNLIYTLIKVLSFFLYTVIDAIGKVLVILYDDYALFFRDVNYKLEALFTGIYYIIEMVGKSTYDTCLAILNQFTYIFTTGSVKISNVGEILTQSAGGMLINIKAYTILIGNSCWFLITLLPNFILYLLQLFGLLFKYLLQKVVILLTNSYMALWQGLAVIVNYFADVPVQSAVGLIAVILIYKNIFMIAPILKLIVRCIRAARRILQWIVPSFFILTNRIMQFRLPNLIGFFLLRPRVPLNIEENHAEDIYQTPPRVNGKTPPGHQQSSGKKLLCVICQDQEKCMLLLPCRHLCVCFECSGKSRYYNDICPICRIPINDKVRIYI